MESAPRARALLERLAATSPGVVDQVDDALEDYRLLLDTEERLAGFHWSASRRFPVEGTTVDRDEPQIGSSVDTANFLIDQATRLANRIIEAVEIREAETEARIIDLRRAGEVADAAARRIAQNVLADADRHRREVEDQGVAMLRQAWNCSVALQEELLAEAEAEVADVLRQAEADAARLRADAATYCCDARALRDRAIDIRTEAERYADQLRIAAIAATPDPEPDTTPEQHVRTVRFRRLLLAALVVLGLLGLRSYLVEPFGVSGASMDPTLADGDRVVVNKMAYRLHDPRRGDVVVIGGDSASLNETLVKRIVGIAGDTVAVRGNVIRVNGAVAHTEVVDITAGGQSVVTTVGEDEVFVVGDNLPVSLDSRTFGPVREDRIIGRVEAVIWPPTDFHTL